MEQARGLSRARLPGALEALMLGVWGAALLAWPSLVRESVAQSALYCLSSLAPSLFPFMALTSLAARTRGGDVLGRLLAPVTRHVFRLPAPCGPAVLLGFLGGYPAGARCVSLLLEEGKITPAQGERMLLCCVNPGPAFVVTFLGCGLLGSPEQGWLLFGAVSLGGLLLGALTGLGKPLPSRERPPLRAPRPGALAAAVGDASSAVVKMCGCILLFSGFTALLRGSGLLAWAAEAVEASGLLPQEGAAVCLSFLLEVTGGAGDAAQAGAGAPLYALGLGFGGLCVHLQVFAFFREFPGSRGKFFLFRLLHGLGAFGLCLLGERFFPPESQPAWAASARPLALGGSAAGWAGGLSLVLLCGAFLLIAAGGPSGDKDCARGKSVV